jgi:hypothetical protein
MRNVYYPYTKEVYAVPIENGGTGSKSVEEAAVKLNILTRDMANKINGWLSMPADGTISPNYLPTESLSKKPSLTGPVSVTTGISSQFTINNFDSFTVYNFTDVTGNITRVEDIITFVPTSSNGQTGFTINGHSYKFPVTAVGVNKPTINPLVMTSGVGPYLSFISSPFAVTGITAVHVTSDWEISDTPSFTVLLPGSVTGSSIDKTTFSISSLPQASTLYVRVRYNAQGQNPSEWSDSLTFITSVNYAPSKPNIIFPVNNSSGINTSLTAISSTFVSNAFDTNGQDRILNAEWQYSLDPLFPIGITTTVVKPGTDTPTSLVINNLTINVVYYLRVRYIGTIAPTAISEWSSSIGFTTSASFKPGMPSLIYPVSGSTDQPMTFSMTSSAFVTASGDTHLGSSWQINSNSSFTGTNYTNVINSVSDKVSTAINGLPSNTTMYARVKHVGVVTGESDWSPIINFKTKAVIVNTPIISGAATAATTTPTFTSTAFGLTPVSSIDTHASSTWELSDTSSFANILATNIGGTASGGAVFGGTTVTVNTKTTWTVGTGVVNTALLNNNSYYVRVKHISSTSGESQWSPTFSFTIGGNASVINTPVISVVGSDVSASLLPSFTSSNFTTTPVSSLSHSSSLWEIATSPIFGTSVVAVNTTVADTRTTWTITTSLVAGTTYYIRVKYTASDGSVSAWSPIVTLTTSTISGNLSAVTIVASQYTVTYGQTSTVTVKFSPAPVSSGDFNLQILVKDVATNVWVPLPSGPNGPVYSPVVTSANLTTTAGDPPATRTVTFPLEHAAITLAGDINMNIKAVLYQMSNSANTATGLMVSPFVFKAAVTAVTNVQIIDSLNRNAIPYNDTTSLIAKIKPGIPGAVYTYTLSTRTSSTASFVPVLSNQTVTITGTADVNGYYSFNIPTSFPNNSAASVNFEAVLSVKAANQTTAVDGTASLQFIGGSANISSVEFSVGPVSIPAYSFFTMYVAINDAPASAGNIKVQIEAYDSSTGTWIPAQPAYAFIVDAPVSSFVSGSVTRRFISFSLQFSSPASTAYSFLLRAKAYQETNTANMAVSPSVAVTFEALPVSGGATFGP